MKTSQTIAVVSLSLSLILSSACSARSPSKAALENVDWKLVKLGEKPLEDSSKGNSPNLLLNSQDKKVAGKGGCNLFRGSYQLTEKSLTFQGILSTKMACPALPIETEFFKALESTATWTMEGGNLHLRDESGVTLAEFKS